jgi:hypothetical protein
MHRDGPGVADDDLVDEGLADVERRRADLSR